MRTLEEKGIGRPSTYAPTITTILARGYVMRENKRLFPTELGRTVNAMMMEYFGPIIDIDFTAGLEDELDEVAEGEMDWRQVLREFYPPFESMLESAEEKIEKVEIKDEPSDVVCDKCGAQMVYRVGRFGKFLACPQVSPNAATPSPSSPISRPNAQNPAGGCWKRPAGKTANSTAASIIPECDFVSWEMPVDQRCEKCGSYMTLKRSRKGETWYLCSNETCRHRVPAPGQTEADE